VQSLSIKSTKSTSLPIWSCKLGAGEGARWHDSAIEDEESEDDEETTTPEVPLKAKISKTKQPPDRRGKLTATKAT
jgi:ribosome biogenesis protein UTP30